MPSAGRRRNFGVVVVVFRDVGSKRLDVRVCLVATVAVSLSLVSSASAAFPGRNGVLAVRPLHGTGIVLVGRSGRGGRRICTKVSVCGDPGRPQFSPDGRSILFAGPAVRLVGTDGICQNCRFGVAAAPAFRGDGTLVTFASGVSLLEDGIDGIRRGRWSGGSAAGCLGCGLVGAGNARGRGRRTDVDRPAGRAAVDWAG